jgi:hypothetical protein
MFGIIGATLSLRRRQLPSFAAAWADPPTRSTLMNIGLWTVIGLTALPMNNRAHFGGLIGGAAMTWILTTPREQHYGAGRFFGVVFAIALVFATRPWMYGKLGEAIRAREAADAAREAREAELLARCEKGQVAACHAFAITMPFNAGDTTRELEDSCYKLSDIDACAAWGWTLAHGRPGVPMDRPRGEALLESTCARGNAWACELAKGRDPVEALPAAP